MSNVALSNLLFCHPLSAIVSFYRLEQGDMAKTPSNQALAAKEIRQWVKEQGFDGIQVLAESGAGYDAVQLNAEDVTPDVSRHVREHVKQYQYGKYNGMEDIYDITNRRADIPQVMFVMYRSTASEKMNARIWAWAKSNCEGLDDLPGQWDDVGPFTKIDTWGGIYSEQLCYGIYSGDLDEYRDASAQFWQAEERGRARGSADKPHRAVLGRA